jgi:hypothetical protein
VVNDAKEITMEIFIIIWMVWSIIGPGTNWGHGWRDDDDTVRFFDKSLKPSGFYDRETNTTFDKNFRPTGTIYDFDRD